jgi:hypothetical protein
VPPRGEHATTGGTALAGREVVSQVFSPGANTIVRVCLVAIPVALVLVLVALALGFRWPYGTRVGVVEAQPIPFSHKHHVNDDGIDCRYCHTSVEESDFAGIPSTEVCMNCHRQIWNRSPLLEPVRDSYRTGQPIVWNRVHELPDFVFFKHAIHVAKGIGCSTCHGRVDLMPLVRKAESLTMTWCLDCHRNPERFVRPREQVFNMAWQAPPNQLEVGRRLVREYAIQQKTSCSICHH